MPNHATSAPGVGRQIATCPECGAAVPVLGGRWLAVHREGSAVYAYPRGVTERCPGSLLTVPQSELRDQ